MKKEIYFFITILSLIIIALSCENNEVISPSNDQNELLSKNMKGCVSGIKEGGTIIEIDYRNGELEINLEFIALCSVEIQNKIEMEKGKINILISDTSKVTSRCICNQGAEYIFRIDNSKEIEIIIAYRPKSTFEYSTLVDTLFVIN